MHRDFDAGRREIERDPVTFSLAGETFTITPTPSLGDVFELADAPDVAPEEFDPASAVSLTLVRTLKRFIRSMIEPDDRPRFDAAMFRVGSHEGWLFVEIASWIAEQVTGFPTSPSAGLSGGRSTTRTGSATSKRSPAGRSTSKPSRRGGRSG